jgi:polyhydroxyalkanoate synthesis regulator phasin
MEERRRCSGRTHYGVIAQQVEEVLPEIVKRGDDGVRKVAYRELIPVLIEAVKEQQGVIKNQMQTITDLHRRVSILENKLTLADSLTMAETD